MKVLSCNIGAIHELPLQSQRHFQLLALFKKLNCYKKTYLVGTSIGNKGVSCEVGEKGMENIKRLAKRQAEETKAQINSVCPNTVRHDI